jgi:hypothetical protein
MCATTSASVGLVLVVDDVHVCIKAYFNYMNEKGPPSIHA